MNPDAYQLTLSFEQILGLVRQLPEAEKRQLNQTLEQDLRQETLADLLATFKTDELSLETITAETEIVRAELYAQQ
jgi:hypothetical protein